MVESLLWSFYGSLESMSNANISPKTRNSMSLRENCEINPPQCLNSRMEFLRREENELMMREARLFQERQVHEKRLKLWGYERNSKWNNYQIFRSRYQLGVLIGKGGFSEVYKAMDLETCREVALKIHEVDTAMRDEEKEFYVRHAMREADIQKGRSRVRICSPGTVKCKEIL